MDERLIKDAKKIAGDRGTSLSKMVSNYFRSLSMEQKKEFIESPILSEVSGLLASKKTKKELLRSYKKHIEEKYL
ncbi:MAG: hypothetical protein HY754_15395, partial [Nitrospirae bacterium]|nr:hypothetical protein [Nitrospirota bacterium]